MKKITLLLSILFYSISSYSQFNDCELDRSKFWKLIQDYYEFNDRLNLGDKNFSQKQNLDISSVVSSDAEVAVLQSQIVRLISDVVRDLDGPQRQELLSALEQGIVLEDRYTELVKQIQLMEEKQKNYLMSAGKDCSHNEVASFGAPNMKQLMNSSLALAYQSCEVLNKEPLNQFTQDVVGISVVGKHPDGVGNKRMISSLSDVVATHPYIKNISYGNACFNVAKNPLIYDYGGKPYTTSDNESSIDFFKDMGSGTSVLGIDCSGYVFSILASGGLRLHPDRILKAHNVHGIRSHAFVDPANNGMPCLEKINVGPNQSLKEGDIVAIPGHVVMLESVGADAFGNEKKKKIEDCDQININDFDFNVVQSSPENNAVGINKYLAKDYLAKKGTIRSGLEAYAKAQCRAKFLGSVVRPNIENTSVVRHKRTAECMTRPVRLERQSCVSSCSSWSLN